MDINGPKIKDFILKYIGSFACKSKLGIFFRVHENS